MPNETDLFRRAAYEERDIQELQRDTGNARPKKLGLTTTWDQRDGAVNYGRDAKVVRPSAEEVAAYADPNLQATCGSCVDFNIDSGRQKIIEERFAEKLVKEQEWQLKHLCVPAEMLGVCDQSAGEMVTTIVSKACDAYRAQPTRAGRWRL